MIETRDFEKLSFEELRENMILIERCLEDAYATKRTADREICYYKSLRQKVDKEINKRLKDPPNT